ncbi:MAG: single-stranded DNA-binding protein, partial [Anaerolineae bacterium]|nr:single-stranded DNA-binding protein [Anaerolineae bacterium]
RELNTLTSRPVKTRRRCGNSGTGLEHKSRRTAPGSDIMTYQMHIIVGHLGDTPELREANGQSVTNFSVAVNIRRGEQQSTTWYRVTAWNGLAETVCQYLEKGRRVLVDGSNLRSSAYIDRDGQPRASLELTANRVQFLDSVASDGEQESASNGDNSGGEDIPF